ncbi:UDP-N-acetylglucosamine 2-epimerase [Acetatifactor muris]|uniref:GDP/UDP-N,N'-diacetylbacillosamine 2-epimerase (Hydrolyzing) n=1 Tax=Acetatifactor muris TaxID=879566 RepID=A0A2K4ZI38_9FIRM|nr:UDP-N-acetylglucosamine 2-epimerase [Acetatifactor muris]MCR2048345.1 UDP-N-acetylglucosamine 2-epimerase [Acetatifactor muris]SOY30149.1 GDP/UDP-N,N'-diacetylbacillosamine 2-epimerase (hydrolyzing) [Acetatifactor muris]
MKRIVVLTATRAEYGLLKPIMEKLKSDPYYDTRIVVTGMHLSPEFGMTVREIKSDNVPIDKKIEIVLSSDTPVALSKSMGLALISFSEYFEECRPDALMVLGDRYETLAVCCAAMNARIPIFHLHGGETTEGAIDEAIRHSITKMSYLHFTSTEGYRKRVIQMGEAPDRVFNIGAMGVENALNIPCMSVVELEESIGFALGERYAVGTFHPVTLEKATAGRQMEELLAAVDQHKDIRYLFTGANSDTDGRNINQMLKDYAKCNDNFCFVDSLGIKRYLSALKNSLFVIGNSSSGLVEAPSFKIPTINIGDRQRGRISGETVIHCKPERDAIGEAIHKAMDGSFREAIKKAGNPYGDGHTSEKIVEIIKDYFVNDRIDIKKKFFDISFEI